MLSPADIQYFSKGIKPNQHLFACQHCEQIFGLKNLIKHLAKVHNENAHSKSWNAHLLRCTKAAAVFQLSEKRKGIEVKIDQAVEKYIKSKRRKYAAFQLNEKREKEKRTKLRNQYSSTEPIEIEKIAITDEEWEQQMLDAKIKESTTVYLTWDDIVFDKDKISFRHKTEFILSVELQGVVKELNLLKEGYFKKHYDSLLKFLVYRSGILKDQSPGWHKIKNTVYLVEERVRRDKLWSDSLKNIPNGLTLPLTEGLTNTEIVEKFAGNIAKSYYIQLLAGMHLDEKKIMPIIEKMANAEEVGFIFTIRGKRDLYLIWENCNDKRGAHIFVNSNRTYDKVFII